jgi:Uma2 family endonuclease
MSKVVRESAAAYGANVRPMSVDEYYLAADAGVFGSDEKLELLRGEVLQLSPERSLHAWAIETCEDLLKGRFATGSVRSQHPIDLDEFSQPEPDVVVVKGHKDLYLDKHPTAEDVWLVVEVSDTSLKKDRTLKASLYAEFGIPEYWIVDLQNQRLEVHREPKNGRYSVSEVLSSDAFVKPVHGAEQLSVGDLFPKK